jgi:cbb3-type cytochrome oxidase cytochrome c subunit
MILKKEFFDNLDKLAKHKTNPDLTSFFETVQKLEKIGEAMNVERIATSPDTLKLEKQTQVLIKKLKDHKDEIARRTKTQKEFDAVYACIDYLGTHFKYQI